MRITTYYLSQTGSPDKLLGTVSNYWMAINNLTNSTCSAVTLQLMSVKWDYIMFRLENAIALDVPNRDGIQAACSNVDITVTDSFMADKEFNIYSNKKLQFFMRNSTFQGQDGGNNAQGGIHFNITCDANITVDETVFSGLKLYDLISAQFALKIKLQAALLQLTENVNLIFLQMKLKIFQECLLYTSHL